MLCYKEEYAVLFLLPDEYWCSRLAAQSECWRTHAVHADHEWETEMETEKYLLAKLLQPISSLKQNILEVTFC